MSVIFCLFLLVVCVFSLDSPCTGAQDERHEASDTEVYCYKKFGATTYDRNQAKLECENWFPYGGSVVAIHSDGEQSYIENMMSGNNIWLGVIKISFATALCTTDMMFDDQSDLTYFYSHTRNCGDIEIKCLYIDSGDYEYYEIACGNAYELICYFKVPICGGILANESSTICSGHGNCFEDNTCTCDEFYFGDDCQSTHMCGGLRQDNPSVCGKNGNCSSPENCICNPGWSGATCNAWVNGSCTGDSEVVFEEKCYKNFGGGMNNFDTAESFCRFGWVDSQMDSHLMSIDGPLTNNWIKSSIMVDDQAWTGLRKKNESIIGSPSCPPNGGYIWTDESTTNYAIARGVSISCNNNSEYCVTILKDEYFWYDTYCGGESDVDYETICSYTIPTCKGIPSYEEEVVCSGYGSCQLKDNCSCYEGYDGTFCDFWSCYGVLMIDEDDVCSGHGVCNGPDFCECDVGWTGYTCNTTSCFGIPSEETDIVCSSHGTCVSLDVCLCDWEWADEECDWELPCLGETIQTGSSRKFCEKYEDVDLKNYYEAMDECKKWHVNSTLFTFIDAFEEGRAWWYTQLDTGDTAGVWCNGFKTDRTDTTGTACNKATPGLYWGNGDDNDYLNSGMGTFTKECNSVTQECVRPKTSNGGSDYEMGDDSCSAPKRYLCAVYLSKCNTYWANEYNDACNGNGICVGQDTCICKGTGEGYVGQWCETRECYGILSNYTDIVCSGKGDCIEDDTCQCDDGWFGDFCNITICDGIWSNDTSQEAIDNICSGYGECIKFDKCKCDEFYFGDDCDQTYCNWERSTDSGSVCSGRGSCFPLDNCTCFDGDDYWGEWCEITSCFGFDGDEPGVCGNGGSCIEKDVCQCDEGYFGDQICNVTTCKSIYSNETDIVCSGKGTCFPKDVCTCDSSDYFGDGDCDQTTCFGYWYLDSRACSAHGVCVGKDICQCNVTAGYLGEECEITTCNGILSNSSDVCFGGHGKCYPKDICECFGPPYIGTFCEIAHPCKSEGEKERDGYCFKNFGQVGNWNQSYYICKGWFKGGSSSFISINSSSEDTWVANEIRGGIDLLLGAVKRNTTYPCPGPSGGYIWQDGETSDAYAVSKGSTGVVCTTNNTCIALSTTGTVWKDVDCESSTSYDTGCMFKIPYCFGVAANNESSVCSGHGFCFEDNNCTCHDGFGRFGNDKYHGPSCNLTYCSGLSSTDPSGCNDHGKCVSYELCECDDNDEDYFGKLCQYTYCDGIPSSSVFPRPCNGKGHCFPKEVCQCYDGYYGESCNVTTCNSFYSNSSLVCYGRKGVCWPKDVCSCIGPPFIGEYCELAHPCTSSGEYSHQGQCYKNLGSVGDWNTSEISCQGWSKGQSRLISLSSDSERDFVAENVMLSTLDPRTMFVGAVKVVGGESLLYPCPLSGGYDWTDPNTDDTYLKGTNVNCTLNSTCIAMTTNNLGEFDLHDVDCYNFADFEAGCEYRIPVCFDVQADEPSIVCSSHGYCFEDNNCTCVDDYSFFSDDYFGDNCNNTYCDVYKSTNLDEVCNGHGNCWPFEICQCSQDYYGLRCDITTCGLFYSNDTSNVCSGNDAHVSCWPMDQCNCQEGYFGDICDVTTCSSIYSNRSDEVCSGGHGSCWPEDQCNCWEDEYRNGEWGGYECQEPNCFGVWGSELDNVCSGGYGNCTLYDHCECYKPDDYFGENCEYTFCYEKPTNEIPLACNGHGICWPKDNCTCERFDGWYGRECEEFFNKTLEVLLFANLSQIFLPYSVPVDIVQVDLLSGGDGSRRVIEDGLVFNCSLRIPNYEEYLGDPEENWPEAMCWWILYDDDEVRTGQNPDVTKGIIYQINADSHIYDRVPDGQSRNHDFDIRLFTENMNYTLTLVRRGNVIPPTPPPPEDDDDGPPIGGIVGGVVGGLAAGLIALIIMAGTLGGCLILSFLCCFLCITLSITLSCGLIALFLVFCTGTTAGTTAVGGAVVGKEINDEINDEGVDFVKDAVAKRWTERQSKGLGEGDDMVLEGNEMEEKYITDNLQEDILRKDDGIDADDGLDLSNKKKEVEENDTLVEPAIDLESLSVASGMTHEELEVSLRREQEYQQKLKEKEEKKEQERQKLLEEKKEREEFLQLDPKNVAKEKMEEIMKKEMEEQLSLSLPSTKYYKKKKKELMKKWKKQEKQIEKEIRKEQMKLLKEEGLILKKSGQGEEEEDDDNDDDSLMLVGVKEKKKKMKKRKEKKNKKKNKKKKKKSKKKREKEKLAKLFAIDDDDDDDDDESASGSSDSETNSDDDVSFGESDCSDDDIIREVIVTERKVKKEEDQVPSDGLSLGKMKMRKPKKKGRKKLRFDGSSSSKKKKKEEVEMDLKHLGVKIIKEKEDVVIVEDDLDDDDILELM